MTHHAFQGTDRFKLLRPLGEGGMGVVYEAHDARRNEVVALKTLHFADADAVYRLKQEFRALAGVTHRNLIALYELFADSDDWFFTMELVPGADFLEFVRPQGCLDEARLRATLPQLAEGISAIHQAGKLHRDLKPSNVMVTTGSRAVILDFGIASDLPGLGGDVEVEQIISGTPAYMAPEQAEGAAVPASDWYALGGMLYEALTGRLPYEGLFFTVVGAKLTAPAPRADLVTPDAPPDLVDLCNQLMQREPAARPTGDEVLRLLGAGDANRQTIAARPSRTQLIGRDVQLEGLRAARRAAAMQPVITLLQGLSGTGKSTLLDEYLGLAARDDRAVVFAGRCFVRETVPFKGLDGVLDSMSRWLLALPDARRAEVASPALAAAARLFPSLGRIEWLADGATATAQDPEQVRRDAVAALRALLRAVVATGPVILAVDDFQWGDRDSARLLEALVAPPDPPPLHLVVAFRSDEVEGNPFLEAYASRARAGGARDVVIGTLGLEESRSLAATLLGNGAAEADAIAAEAGGSPFLIEQLAQYRLAARYDTGARAAVSLADMLARRIGELPAEAGTLLETLAVAARPLDVLVARDAASLTDERPLTTLLLSAHLLRPSGTADHLELYHDKVREAIVARIPAPRLADTHRKLAQAMERRGGADPVTLYEHYLGVGDTGRARRYAAQAADAAIQALAFERAATLYARAIELARQASEETYPLEVKHADALAYTGRGLDAADVYLAAAPQAAPVEALELRRRAADQYLRCGHVGRGFAVVDDVLHAVGVRPTSSRAVALVRLLGRRAAVRLRGLRFTERAAETLPPATIRQLDVCWTVALGLVRVDNLRAADFQTNHLLLALKAGEPYRIARALACEAGFVAVVGGPSRARAERLVTATQELAAHTGNPHALGIAQLAEGITRHFLGEFRASLTACDRAAAILRERCRGVWWEVDSTQEYGIGSLYLLGAWDEVARRAAPALREAESHGDRYSAAYVGAGRGNVAWLLRDDPAEARRVFDTFSAPWAGEAFHVPHWWAMCAEAHIDLYDGQARRALDRFRARLGAVRLSGLLRVQVVRVETAQVRGRIALAALPGAPASDRNRLLRLASGEASALLRERMPWATALGLLVRAGVAYRRGNHNSAAADLREGIRIAEAQDLAGYTAAARRQLGRLLGGTEGKQLVRDADDWYTRIGGGRPERFAAMLVPGFPD